MSEDKRSKWVWVPNVADPSTPTLAEVEAGVPLPGLAEPEPLLPTTYTCNPSRADYDDRWERLRTDGATLLDHNGKAVGFVLPATGPDEDGCYTAAIIRDPFYNDPEAKQ